VVLYAAIDIHKHSFQAAVLDPDSGEVVEERFSADREGLARWAKHWGGRVAAVAIEATTGWRWVWRDLATLVVAIERDHDRRDHADAARTPTKEAAIVLTA
jgi:hypothetical protein